jgi:Uma2 family endonuclease
MSVAAREIQRYVTAEELWRLPDNGTWRELVKGVVWEMPPPGEEHGGVAANVHGHLWNHVRVHKLGRVYAAETGFLIRRDPDTVRAPDCAFIVRDRARRPLSKTYCEVIPDLVVEVVSPHDTAEEVAAKVREWIEAGVRLVWVVYPGIRAVAIHRSAREITLLREDDELTGDDIVPGFAVAVGEVFE